MLFQAKIKSLLDHELTFFDNPFFDKLILQLNEAIQLVRRYGPLEGFTKHKEIIREGLAGVLVIVYVLLHMLLAEAQEMLVLLGLKLATEGFIQICDYLTVGSVGR